LIIGSAFADGPATVVFIIFRDLPEWPVRRKKCKYIFIFAASKEKILSKFEYRYNAPEARDFPHEMHQICAR
jgi:hypothetical protein